MTGDRTAGARVFAGFGIGLALQLLQIPLAFVSSKDLISLMFIGATQLVYMLPAIAIARRRDQPGIVKGITIAASIVFLINAACWGLVFSLKF